ncbi:uncharacterized protein F4812DRAFT_466005 [Daldinia caldariorum]|uniref:uncharacterized protein n=1 Tax=Daldinia caldariorum TaxID=326644 RepID=UPI002007B746|nr:uncharacterized protein F4812DRAFT_466005 [Daldinia caldariorum]KAI1466187.1 hypothetical protein F4812DRAFT_466005 [Daldinia caldariorum]
MSGSPTHPSLKEAEQRAMNAMMDDLGNNRLEELATDGNQAQRRDRESFLTSHNNILSPQPNQIPPAGGPVAKWKNAFSEGLFNDSDYHAVKDLNLLDGGNAHRLSRAEVMLEHEGSRNVISHNNRPGSHAKSNVPMYDPLNPGYVKKPKRPAKPVQSGYREASLGGIVPPGAEIKQWNSKSRREASVPAHWTAKSNAPRTRRGTSVAEKPQRPAIHRRENTILPHEWRLPEPTANTPSHASNNLVQAKKSQPDRVVFNDKNVTIMLVFGVGEFSPGQVSVFERPQNNIVMWQLSIDNGKATRGDIRLCLSPFQYGSKIHLRRQDGENSEVRSSLIRFDNILAANEFQGVVNSYRKQQQNSQEPLYMEVTETDSLAELQLNAGNKNSGKTDEQASKNEVPQTHQPRVGTPTRISPVAAQDVEVSNEDLIDLSSPKSLKIQTSSSDLIDLTDLAANPKPVVRLPVVDSIGVPELANLQRVPVLPTLSECTRPTTARSQTMSPSVMTQYSFNLSTAMLSTSQLEQDVTTIETIRPGEDISQDSLRVLSFLTMRDYQGMVKMYRYLSEFFKWAWDSSPIPAAKLAAMQVAMTQLKKYEEFGGLNEDDQKKAIAVVYANVMHGNAPIIRSIDEMITLRQRASPCPRRVHRFNDVFFKVTELLELESSSVGNYALDSESSRSIARDAEAEQSMGQTQTEGTSEKTRKFLDLLRSYNQEPAETGQTDVKATGDAIRESPASTLQAGASPIPRTNLVREGDALRDRTTPFGGLRASRWANHTENHANTPTPSHERTATGKLSPVSGITGRLSTL